jgi:predicted DNA-binding transcriptional regulator AlpA
MVSDRRMPKPKRVDGRVVWDRIAIDAAFSDLPTEAENKVDEILARGRP